MPSLSVAMIVKDEEAWIGRALASVQTVADEIVVVDTGSHDRTVAIAAANGAKVHHCPWSGHFAAARNVALDLCTGDWVLAIDADEELTPAAAVVVRELLLRPVVRPTVYLSRIINVGDAGEADGAEHYASRLFQRRPELRWVGRIHEYVQHVAADDAGLDQLRVSGFVLRHYGYTRTVVAERDKDARNFALLQQAVDEEPANWYHRFNLGVTLRGMGRLSEAIEAYQAAIELCREQRMTPGLLATAHSRLIAALGEAGRNEEAIAAATSCQALCREQPDFWLSLGHAYLEAGQAQAAVDAYASCLSLQGRVSPVMVDRGALSWKPHVGLAAAYQAMGEWGKAVDHLQMAQQGCPEDEDLRRRLASVMAQRGIVALTANDVATAEGALRRAAELNPQDAIAWHHLGIIALRREAIEMAVDCYQRALTLQPELAAAHLDLAKIAVFQERPAEAYAHLQQVLAIDARHVDALSLAADVAGLLELPGDCQSHLQALIEAEPDDPDHRVRLAYLYLHHGEAMAAVQVLGGAMSLPQRDAAVYTALGVALLEVGQLEDARNAFMMALQLAPENAEALKGFRLADQLCTQAGC